MNNEWTAGNSGLPGLSGCNGSFFYWDPLFFPLWPCLQNRRGLDSLTDEKGRLCLFLGKDCCFFTNKFGVLRDGIKKKKNLRDRAQQLTSSQPTDILSSLYPWLILLAILLILVCLALMFLPCLINILQKFLQEHITAISQATSGD
jgi:hypothetical protein